MHLFNLAIITAITMLMTLNLSEELLLGISILILLITFIYLFIEDIYDFSYNQRKLTIQKVLSSLQELEKAILEYQLHLKEISNITRAFQVLAIETFEAKSRSLQRRQNEFRKRLTIFLMTSLLLL